MAFLGIFSEKVGVTTPQLFTNLKNNGCMQKISKFVRVVAEVVLNSNTLTMYVWEQSTERFCSSSLTDLTVINALSYYSKRVFFKIINK